ncbi:MAG: AIR synthase related protein [Deinococcales bacterium]
MCSVFGPQDLPSSQHLGNLHPKRIQAGVVAGVGDYGNKMGVPTVNGAVIYHEGYTANPLVIVVVWGWLLATATKPSQRSVIIS